MFEELFDFYRHPKQAAQSAMMSRTRNYSFGSRDARLLLTCVLLAALGGRHWPHFGSWTMPAAAPVSRLFAVPAEISPAYFFGGRPVRGLGKPVDLGPPSVTWLAKFLPFLASRAQPVASCLAATALPPTGAAPAQVSDAVPGFFGAPWVAHSSGNLIAALNVYVPRDASDLPPAPLLQIYRRGETVPAFAKPVPVQVIRGSRALLYRMIVAGPIACIDLVVPNGAGAGDATIYYPFHGRMFAASASFTVQK
jgi:hypothetical protein